MLFAALADETRINIMAACAKKKGASLGEIMEALPDMISQPNASHHAGILVRVGLLDRKRDGRRQCFTPNAAVAGKLALFLAAIYDAAKPATSKGKPKAAAKPKDVDTPAEAPAARA
jgi:DNA-binding transcriptional ArsR family regulator